jgi:hypothetical protein
MSFETISLLLNWMEMGALLAILFRLSSTFNLIANTQRELRHSIYYLGERRGAELGTDNAFDRPGIAPPQAPDDVDRFLHPLAAVVAAQSLADKFVLVVDRTLADADIDPPLA